MVYIGPPLEAERKEEKMYLKLPRDIINQSIDRGRFILVYRLHGAKLNIDSIGKWANLVK